MILGSICGRCLDHWMCAQSKLPSATTSTIHTALSHRSVNPVHAHPWAALFTARHIVNVLDLKGAAQEHSLR